MSQPAAPLTTTPQKRPGTFSALKHRNFRLMWISLLVSNSGTWLQSVAQDYLVYQLTHRALDLGLVNGVRAVALILLSFFGGTLADRVDRRKLLIWTQSLFAASAVLLGLLIQLHVVQVWHIVALSFINAVLLAADQPARQSLLPHLVPREDLMNAIALNSVTFTGAQAIGPMLAAPIVKLLGTAWGFHLNGLSFLAVILAVWAMRLPATATPSRKGEPPLEAITTGARYIAGSPIILLLVSLLTVFSLFLTPFQAVLPVFATNVFHGDEVTLGLLRAAMGFGALVGGFLMAGLSHRGRKGWLALTGGLLYAGISVIFAGTSWLWLSLGALFVSSIFMTLFQSAIQTLMQQLTDDKMRGRVMSLYAICVIGMWPLGALPMSWATDAYGASHTVVAGSIVAAVYAGIVALIWGRKMAKL